MKRNSYYHIPFFVFIETVTLYYSKHKMILQDAFLFIFDHYQPRLKKLKIYIRRYRVHAFTFLAVMKSGVHGRNLAIHKAYSLCSNVK